MDRGDEPHIGEMAAELYYLRENAKAAGEEFLSFLIDLAAKEAERLGAEAVEARETEGERLPA